MNLLPPPKTRCEDLQSELSVGVAENLFDGSF